MSMSFSPCSGVLRRGRMIFGLLGPVERSGAEEPPRVDFLGGYGLESDALYLLWVRAFAGMTGCFAMVPSRGRSGKSFVTRRGDRFDLSFLLAPRSRE